MACGAYDPWAKKNKLIYEFFHDVIQGVAFGLLPSPVYVSVDLEQKKLVSFSSLIKEGKVFYDPNYDPKKVHLSLIADLGPLAGIPCALSISGSRMNPLEYYAFNGISFSGCHNNSKVEIEANNAEEIRSSGSSRSYCAACAINLQTMSSSVSSLNPILRFSFFLIKGVTRLFSNLRDPHDLHRNWSLSSHQIALSYRYHGEISDQCAKDLIKGKYGVADLITFKQRMNVFLSGDKKFDVFKHANFKNIAVSGSMIAACLPNFNPLILNVGCDFEAFVDEYYGSADLDILCNIQELDLSVKMISDLLAETVH
jgi:hypothetical protein